MRVLLIGEYSGHHNAVKEGLEKLGHEVLLVGNGDGFKNYPVDINISHSFHNKILKKFKVGFFKLTSIDLGSLEVYLKAISHLKKFKGFDVVELMNESALSIAPKYQIRFLKKILKYNKKLVLISSGIDHQCMSYMMEGKFRYSIMSPYLEDQSLYETYQFQLQYLNEEFTNLHNFIYKQCYGVIASDMDYHIPLVGHEKYLGLAPNPINTDRIEYIPIKIDEKIKIFHGVNTSAMHKKGNHFFIEALKIIEEKYADKVEIKTTYSIPYDEYITLYEDCHILLDQVYAFDQGFNALEAMAKGKVVFTGAEQEWLDYYNLKEDTVAINTLPDAKKIAEKLEWLILNPDQIHTISKNARAFVEKEHHYLKATKNYIEKWNVTKP
ncbi:glycosyltransferase family protein [Psychroserpens jangbogonensis]|uniref:glycosyltransferase family protein n=1 Tax=Psychroserpens jangbogonensis TaxID=1484460 RepID=UPI00053E957B|nr:glycosyltransferase [Psychroserpens jangbogonensis]